VAHSLSFLLSSEAATARMAERKPSYVVHLEVAPYTDAPLTELDAENRDHAYNIARTWLTNGRAVSVGIRRVRVDGTLVAADILDLSDFEDDLADETQSNLNKLMSHYGLTF